MSVISERISELKNRISNSKELLSLDTYESDILDLEKKMNAPDFWNNQEVAKQVSQKAVELKKELDVWNGLEKEIKDVEVLEELLTNEQNVEVEKEIEETVENIDRRLRKLELSTLFTGEMDEKNAIVSIHAGAGGTDAMDWAGILFRMFSRFIEDKGWSLEVIDSSPGEEAGFKSITFAVQGRRAYGYFRSEAGVHRLVRISPFDAEKMRHTSFALVEVLPEIDEVSSDFIIDPKDLRIDTFMSSGKGGQSVNTTYSAVRVTHIPTNTVVTCQNERSQIQNKETALTVLRSRLFSRMLEERAEKLDELKGGYKSPEWGNQIRSYVLHPYKMVKDHRTNFETQNADKVLDGDLDNFIEAYLRFEVETNMEKK